VTNLENALRKAAYDVTLDRGAPPSVRELAARCGVPEAEVRSGLSRLAAARMMVLQPSSGELLMVPPFSGVPTPFLVQTVGHECYANCVWDALGVAVMLREVAEIVTACGCCGESMTLRALADAPPHGAGVVHFAVPARRWWDDIVYT
jgi:hypothetical protein